MFECANILFLFYIDLYFCNKLPVFLKNVLAYSDLQSEYIEYKDLQSFFFISQK